MTYYNKIKKLDLESAKKMQEGTGPSDKCLCSLLAAPEDEKRSIAGSIKKAFAAIGGTSRSKNRETRGGGGRGGGRGGGASVDIPLSFTKGGKGIFTTKQAVQRSSPCGKCGCDSKKFVLKHSDLSIKVISPDISTICPCPNDCLPNKANLTNNIKVTVEHLQIESDSGHDGNEHNFPENTENEQIIPESFISQKSITDLINAQFDIEEFDDDDGESQWSFGEHEPNEKKSFGENEPNISNEKKTEQNNGESNGSSAR